MTITPTDEKEWALVTQVAELRSEMMMLNKRYLESQSALSEYHNLVTEAVREFLRTLGILAEDEIEPPEENPYAESENADEGI